MLQKNCARFYFLRSPPKIGKIFWRFAPKHNDFALIYDPKCSTFSGASRRIFFHCEVIFFCKLSWIWPPDVIFFWNLLQMLTRAYFEGGLLILTVRYYWKSGFFGPIFPWFITPKLLRYDSPNHHKRFFFFKSPKKWLKKKSIQKMWTFFSTKSGVFFSENLKKFEKKNQKIEEKNCFFVFLFYFLNPQVKCSLVIHLPIKGNRIKMTPERLR